MHELGIAESILDRARQESAERNGARAARENASKINPGIDLLELSCTTRKGLDEWLAWVYRRQHKTAAASAT